MFKVDYLWNGWIKNGGVNANQLWFDSLNFESRYPQLILPPYLMLFAIKQRYIARSGIKSGANKPANPTLYPFKTAVALKT